MSRSPIANSNRRTELRNNSARKWNRIKARARTRQPSKTQTIEVTDGSSSVLRGTPPIHPILFSVRVVISPGIVYTSITLSQMPRHMLRKENTFVRMAVISGRVISLEWHMEAIGIGSFVFCAQSAVVINIIKHILLERKGSLLSND